MKSVGTWFDLRRAFSCACLALAVAALSGCPAETLLVVEVQTDLVPGVDFDAYEVTLDGAAAGHASVSLRDSFARPHRVMEESGIAVGRHQVRVTLLGSGKSLVRTRQIDVQGRNMMTIVFTRSCLDVTCPRAGGDPGETECAGGSCVSPQCGEAGEPACPEAECSAERACPASSTACIEARCVEGYCLELSRAGACSPSEVCVPGAGCTLVSGDEDDAGSPSAIDASAIDVSAIDASAIDASAIDASAIDASAIDASAIDASAIDAASAPECRNDGDCVDEPCGDGRCVAGRCEVVSRCSAGERCCSGVCAASCSDVPCAGQAAGVTCRAATGVCDVAEVCDGVSPACPPDRFSPASVTCRASAGPCDVPETCTGSSASCPADGFKPSTTECRASAGPCDAAERCTGTHALCPVDMQSPDGSYCDQGCGFEHCMSGVCVGGRTCTGSNICICDSLCAPRGTACP